MKKVFLILLVIILTLSGVVGLMAAYQPPAAQAAQLYTAWVLSSKDLGMLTNMQIKTFAIPLCHVPVADLVRIDIYVKLVSQTFSYNIDVNIGLANSAGPFGSPVPTDKVFNQAGTGLLRSREPVGKEVNYTVTAADMTAMKNAGTDLAYICFGEVGGGSGSTGCHVDITISFFVGSEMDVSGNGTPVADGGNYDFGSQLLNTNTDVTFTIDNTGAVHLTLTTPITIGGADAGQFSIQQQPTSPVVASGNTTFVLRFTPTSVGAKTASISIANNDDDENPYDLTLTGTGLAPEINLKQGVTDIADGGSYDFGTKLWNTNTDVTFTIENTGTLDLTLATPIAIGGTDAGQFSIQQQPTSPVVASGDTTFVVRFTPTSVGVKTASISIANNDDDENPYDLTITGTGFIPLPGIISFTPISGATGTWVTITGTNFTGATSVKFGGTEVASFTVNSDTRITVVLGNGSNGWVSVTTPGGTTVSTVNFTFATYDYYSTSYPSTINLLGTSLNFPTDYSGRLLQTIDFTSPDGTFTFNMSQGTIARDKNGNFLSTLEITTAENPPPPPADCHIIGIPYIFKPAGATFAPPITLTFTYDPASLPPGVVESQLSLAYYDSETGEWVKLDCVVDTNNHTITAQVSHFTYFAIIGVSVPPAEFSVSNLAINPGEAEPGEAVTITATVTNTGGMEGIYIAVLEINGVKEAGKSLAVAAGSSQGVSFSVTRAEAGSYSILVDELSGSFTVIAPPAPAAFSVSNLSIQPVEVLIGEAATISVVVANNGGTEGNYTIVLKINGVKEAEKSVTIAAGGSEAVTFSVTREDAAICSVTIDGLSGSFTVVAPPAPAINWPMVGGIIAGVVLLGVLIFFLVRRKVY